MSDPIDGGTARPDARDAACACASAVAVAACALGLADVALRGRALEPESAAATVLLWAAIAALPALAAGAGAAVLGLALRRRASLSLVAATCTAAGIALAALALASMRAIGTGEAAAGIAAALLALALLPPRPQWMLRAPALAALVLLAAPIAAAGLAVARGGGSAPASTTDPRASAAPARATAAGAKARPNVALIVLDTLRADHLGAYGDARALSPAFDRLAAGGTLFERCYAPAPWTVPSHASLFTGLYPTAHGATFEQHRWLDDGFTTLAEALAAAGYRTAGFAANGHVALANLAQGFETYREIAAPYERLALRRILERVGAPARFTDQGAEQGVVEIDRFLRARDARGDEAPLFLFVNLLEPHWRYLPPARARAAHLPDGVGYLEATLFSSGFYGPLWMARTRAPAPRELSALRGLYAAEVAYQDVRLGHIVASIDRHLGPDTLLVVTADHGENLGEAGRFDHVFAINDHLVHVPMLLRGAGVAAGARDDGPCQLVDVPATVADAVGGLALEPGQSGQSLLPGRTRPRRLAFVEGDPYYGHLERMSVHAGLEADVARFTARLRAAHDGRFKYLVSSRAAPVLYDTQVDPDETRDVGDAHPDVRDALARALDAWLAAQPAYSIEAHLRAAERDGEARGASDEDATFERLRELGYVE